MELDILQLAFGTELFTDPADNHLAIFIGKRRQHEDILRRRKAGNHVAAAQAGTQRFEQLVHDPAERLRIGNLIFRVGHSDEPDKDRLAGAGGGARFEPVHVFKDLVVAVERALDGIALTQVLLDDAQVGFDIVDRFDNLAVEVAHDRSHSYNGRAPRSAYSA